MQIHLTQSWVQETPSYTAGLSPALTKKPFDEGDVVRVSMIVGSEQEAAIPPGTRIIIGNIEGECGQEVKDALLVRLIDNPNYDVLSRDNLPDVLGEIDFNWSGSVNSDTAAEAGEILGASVYIVGRVAFCGKSASTSPDNKLETQHNIRAILQIIDLPTGKLIFSSASEGTYLPRLILPAGSAEFAPPEELKEQTSEDQQGFWGRLWAWLIPEPSENLDTRAERPKDAEPEPEQYARVKAAEEMANSFADKFFGRPTFETAEMWRNPGWRYEDSIHYVKLGYCAEAIQFLETTAAEELARMKEVDVAKYLHNYGVALLCNNQPIEAMNKLRAAYRVGYNQTTLKMLGLASKVSEWSLDVAVNTEPEVEMLYDRVQAATERLRQQILKAQQALSAERPCSTGP